MNTLKSASWVTAPSAKAIIAALAHDNARFVGGCVRNALLGLPVTDIDIATSHHPQEVIKRLNGAGIKTIPTGIDHGTVTAITQDQSYEITTLRRDVATDGRRAVISFSNSWAEDAQRRDFTINTLLADSNGILYDPTGQGLSDLKARRIIFVGNPDQRIKEDVLRILRFFRFYALYGKGAPDAAALKACQTHAHLIPTLSRERITQEFTKIIMAPTAAATLRLMFDHGVLSDFDLPQHWCAFENLCNADNAPAIARLYALIRDSKLAEEFLILTNAQKKQWKLFQHVAGMPLKNNHDVKSAIYYHGRDAVLTLAIMQGQGASTLDLIKNWDIPTFPITAKQLMEQGFTEGPELGAELKRLEQAWVNQGYPEIVDNDFAQQS